MPTRQSETKAIAIIQHHPRPGWLAEALEDQVVQKIQAYEGHPLPEPNTCRGIVILGGPMGAYEDSAYPFLAAEKALIRTAVDSGVPVLGVCLGAQLIADAFGGKARPGERGFEAGFVDVHYTDAGAADPVTGNLSRSVLSWHQDTFDLPAGATLLARSERYLQAFRLGSALAIQFHPEASTELVDVWAKQDQDRLRAMGLSPEAILEEARRREDERRAEAIAAFRAWLSETPAD
jgi:GMP synthase-like glutamine amidotransferase